MKTNKRIALLMFTGIFCALIITSCRKDNDDNDTFAATDNALAETSFTDVHSIVDQAAFKSTTKGVDSVTTPLLGGCAIVTHDTISIPHTIKINFGSTNCLCGDNRTRRGEINVSYTGRYRDSGTVITVTFNNYFVNDNQILGTKIITNKGKNANNNLHFGIDVNGSIVKANNGGTITWTSTRDREWLLGSSTLNWLDDVYLITGSASGTSASGNAFSVNITTPLRKEIGCKHFVSGIFDLNITGKATRTIDFGSGSCDNTATVTINGNTYTITLN